jgi:hypothetical protein
MYESENISRLSLDDEGIGLVQLILANNLSCEQDFRYSLYVNNLHVPLIANAKTIEPFERLVQASLNRVRSMKVICFFGNSKGGRSLLLVDNNTPESWDDFLNEPRANVQAEKQIKEADDERLAFVKLQIEYKYALADIARQNVELEGLRKKIEQQEELIKQFEILTQKLESKLEHQETERPSGITGFLGGLEKVAPGLLTTTLTSLMGMKSPAPALSGTPQQANVDTVSSAEPIEDAAQTNNQNTNDTKNQNKINGEVLMEFLHENFNRNEVSTVMNLLGSLARCKETLPTLYTMIHEQACRNIAMSSQQEKDP